MLDQVTDPRNLGAVCRSAEGPGATGVVSRPRLGGRDAGGRRASAGAVEHLPIAVVTNLARYLEEVKGARRSGSTAPPATPSTTMWDTDLTGGVALVFGAEGKGMRPLVRATCDALVSIPLAGAVESLNVSVAAAVLLYEARRQRACLMADPTLYLFDGYNLLHAGAVRRPARARRHARELRRQQGARGVVVFDGVGEDASSAALGALAARRRHAARAARRGAPRTRAGAARLLGRRRARHRRPRGARSSPRRLPPRPRARPAAAEPPGRGSRDRLDAETRARLERLRRGQ